MDTFLVLEEYDVTMTHRPACCCICYNKLQHDWCSWCGLSGYQNVDFRELMDAEDFNFESGAFNRSAISPRRVATASASPS
jgi:hypothetical protein